MIKKSTLYILFFIFGLFSSQSQTSNNGQNYNSFNSRGFMKVNRFLTVPTFSALRENKTSISAIVRNSNIGFEDNPRLNLLSYSGKAGENIGAGFAIYQQEVGVFKDFGAIANYAHRLQLNKSTDLTFGFNFLYSRRGANGLKVNSVTPDLGVENFQDVPMVVFQPAVTLSFGKFDVGLFFENLLDFDMKAGDLATSFGEKTFSAHAMYSHELAYNSGLFEGADLRFLGQLRKVGTGAITPDEGGVGYLANVIVDLPKAGWVKAGYDKDFGISAGFGVNISERLAIGISYEKSTAFATNEVGLIYNFGKKLTTKKLPKSKTGNISVSLPDYRENEEKRDSVAVKQYDFTNEILQAQDSINKLNKKVDEILRLLKNQPQNTAPVIEQAVPTPTPLPETAERDTSLKRRDERPWRSSSITRTGGGGTMYYLVADRFRSRENATALINKLKRTEVKAKYIFEPAKKWYYVYLDRFSRKKDADKKLKEFTKGNTRLFENEGGDDSEISEKKKDKEFVYVRKITIGGGEGSYKEPKTQSRARVRTMSNVDGSIASGYYLQVYVNGDKAYADRNVDELRNDTIDADYFINPATGNYHTYILKTTSREEAIRLYNNNLNGTFYERKSIIYIK